MCTVCNYVYWIIVIPLKNLLAAITGNIVSFRSKGNHIDKFLASSRSLCIKRTANAEITAAVLLSQARK